MTHNTHLWIRSILAAIISGGAGGIVTAFSAIGIAPDVFNMAKGAANTLHIGLLAFGFHALLGVAMFLQKSPLPEEEEKAAAAKGGQ
jgi:hypothetical protein